MIECYNITNQVLLINLMPKFIIYSDQYEVNRKICVVDGQPFYQSSGTSSEYPGCWLPFLFVVTESCTQLDIPARIGSAFTNHITSNIEAVICTAENGYLLKYDSYNIVNETPFERLPTLDVITSSCRLGSDFNEFILPDQKIQAEQKLELIEDNSRGSCIYKDPNNINLWLINNGAKFITALHREKVKTNTSRFFSNIKKNSRDKSGKNNHIAAGCWIT